MQDLNTIPSVGTFGEVARKANTNFSLLKIAVDLLEHSIEHSRGYFTSASALTTAFPSPAVGDWAIVEVSGTPTIYKCSTNGTWSNSGTAWAGGSVDLAEYLKKGTGDTEAIARSTNWLTSGGVFEEIARVRTAGMTLRRTSMATQNKLTVSNGKVTSNTNAYYHLDFYPCSKGELLELRYQASEEGVSASVSVTLWWSEVRPVVGVDVTSLHASGTVTDLDEHRVSVVAPADGFVMLRWRVKNTNTNNYWSQAYLYRWYDERVLDGYVSKGVLPATWSTNKYINADADSGSYGEALTLGHPNGIVSSFINVEGCSWVQIKNAQINHAAFEAIVAGSVFYDSEQIPLTVAAYLQRSIATGYGTVTVKVPTGAKYLKVSTWNTDAMLPSKEVLAWGEKLSDVLPAKADLDFCEGLDASIKDIDKALSTEVTVYPLYKYAILATGKFGSTATYQHTAIAVHEGEQYIFRRVSGSVRYAFATSASYSSGGDIPLVDGTSVVELLSNGEEVLLTIPEGCSHLLFNAGSYYGVQLWKYRGKLAEKESAEVLAVNDAGFYYLRGMFYKNKLSVGGGKFEAKSSAYYHVYYRQCSKGDQFRIDMVSLAASTVMYGFCEDIPADGGDILELNTKTFSAEGMSESVYLTAKSDGYVFVWKYIATDTSSGCNTYLYLKGDYNPDGLGYYTHKLGTGAFKANKAIVVNENSASYGTEVTYGSNNYGLTGYIDISSYSFLLLRQQYLSGGGLKGQTTMYGSAFYKDEDGQKVFVGVADIAMYAMSGSRNAYSYVRVPSGAQYVRLFGQIASYTYFYGVNREGYADNEESEGSIFSFHPDDVMHPKLLALQKSIRHNSVLSSPAVVFGHISDCHGEDTNSATSVSATTWKRFVEFCRHWKDKGIISDMIDTGDIVEGFMINKRTNPDETSQAAIGWRTDAARVLTVPGNHDTASGIILENGNNGYDWLDNIGRLAYDKYIAPGVASWGVTQPEGAAENGWCFFHKDYVTPAGYNISGNGSAKTTMTLRFIFVDVMGWGYTHDSGGNRISDNTQYNWLSGLLVEAANAGYHVVIAAHGMPMRKRRIECTYTSLTAAESLGSEPWTGYNSKARQICLLVARFQRGTLAGINEGVKGSFLGYVSGHSHYDAIRKAGGIWDYTANAAVDEIIAGHECVDFDDERYPQIEFTVDAGYVQLSELSDYKREMGTANQDNFQLLAFQMYNKHVRCLKIGCHVDQYMRKKDMVDIFCGSISEFDASKTDYSTGLVTKDGIIYRLLKPIVVNGQTSWELSDKVRASRVMSEYMSR